MLEEQYGITVPNAETVKEAIENHIEVGVRAGLFRDASQFEMTQVSKFLSRARVNLVRGAVAHVDDVPDLLNTEYGFLQI